MFFTKISSNNGNEVDNTMQIHKNQNKTQLYLPGYSGSKSRKVSYATTYHRSAQVPVAFPANATHGRQTQCFEPFDVELTPG